MLRHNYFKLRKLYRLTPEQLAQKVLYFAYGSNMHQPRLEARVGRVECLGTYTLPGYKLTFDTGNDWQSFANVKQSAKKTCEGVIYEMTYGQLCQLDWYEGLYERIKEDYKGRRLHVYISNKYRNEECIPRITPDYRNALVLGCTKHNLHESLAIINGIAAMPMTVREYLDYIWD